jgi:hypothetical protein
MGVGKDNAVRGRKPRKIVAALGELVLALAVGRAVLGNRLVERHQRSATAMGEQYDFGDSGLPAQELDTRSAWGVLR